MRIACFHVGLVTANVSQALELYAPGFEYVDTSGDDYKYAREIANRWNTGEDLVLVEHDNEITSEVIPSFEDCPGHWCTFEYEILPPPWTRICNTGLGCVKFSAELQREFDFRQHVVEIPCDVCGNPHPHWGILDVRVSMHLQNIFQITPHVHGRIRHLHPYLALDPGKEAEGVIKVDKGSGFRRLEPGEKPTPPRNGCISASAMIELPPCPTDELYPSA